MLPLITNEPKWEKARAIINRVPVRPPKTYIMSDSMTNITILKIIISRHYRKVTHIHLYVTPVYGRQEE
jgi:hypothetical protein